jgi:hypothetical protein
MKYAPEILGFTLGAAVAYAVVTYAFNRYWRQLA